MLLCVWCSFQITAFLKECTFSEYVSFSSLTQYCCVRTCHSAGPFAWQYLCRCYIFLHVLKCLPWSNFSFILYNYLCRQSWPTKIDVPQDLEDDLTASPLSHATVPQSPARTAENVLNGHRSKALGDAAKKEEIPELAGPALSAVPSVSLKPTTSGRKCLFRVEEDEEEDEEDKKPISLSTQVVLRRKPSVTNRLTSRKSAPVLNQIFEEGESDDEFDMDENLPPKLSRLKMNIASPSTVHKRYHRRKSQGRGSSCSSSETSDDDSESRRRLDKDSGFPYSWHRRDSSEGPPGSQGDGGGQSKPSNGNRGVDKTSPSDNNKGGGSPSGGSSGSTNNTSGSTRRCAGSGNSMQLSSRSAGELVESLKLMSLCLGSQIHGSTKYIIDPQNNLSFSSVKVQEKSTWKMCISSSGSANQASSLGNLKLFSDQMSDTANELERIKNRNLKNNVLQLPLCEKTISVNIQRNPKEGLLCTSSQTSCCHVIWPWPDFNSSIYLTASFFLFRAVNTLSPDPPFCCLKIFKWALSSYLLPFNFVFAWWYDNAWSLHAASQYVFLFQQTRIFYRVIFTFIILLWKIWIKWTIWILM